MRLSFIAEHGGLISAPSQAVERLEELVDSRKGRLGPDDEKWIVSFLGRLQPQMVKRVAALLGTEATKPAQIAAQIMAGELIAPAGSYDDFPDNPEDYQGNDFGLADDPDAIDLRNQTGTAALTDDQEDFELSNYWTDEERAAIQAGSMTAGMPQGPSDEELQNIENEQTGGDYVNSPPALKVRPGNTPDLNTLHPNTRKAVEDLSASSLFDNMWGLKCSQPQPFIYSGVDNRLYIGPPMGYHYNIFDSLPKTKQVELRNIYHGGAESHDMFKVDKTKALPGTVGRVAHGLAGIDPKLAKTTVVGIYAKEGANKQGVLRATIQSLLDGRYIPPDALVIFSERLMLASDLVGGGGGDVKATEDQKIMADLNARYYVGGFTQAMARQYYNDGYWPDKKPVTPEERAFLARKFSLAGSSVRNKWQAELEKAGLLNPGQRWWAPTSESKSSRTKYSGSRIASIGG